MYDTETFASFLGRDTRLVVSCAILIMEETTSREPCWIYILMVRHSSEVLHYLYPVLLILKDHVLMYNINQLTDPLLKCDQIVRDYTLKYHPHSFWIPPKSSTEFQRVKSKWGQLTVDWWGCTLLLCQSSAFTEAPAVGACCLRLHLSCDLSADFAS